MALVAAQALTIVGYGVATGGIELVEMLSEAQSGFPEVHAGDIANEVAVLSVEPVEHGCDFAIVGENMDKVRLMLINIG
jgi:hypothetical protein